MIQSLYCVIVNWNLKDDTLACVKSLLTAGAVPGQIIVVDNGSIDGSVQALKENHTNDVHLIECAENLGFSQGNNLGIQHALQGQAGWVLLINNDTLVEPSFLDQLELVAESHPDTSLIGPLIFYFDDPERIWYLGDRLIPGTLATYSLYRDQLMPLSLPTILPVDFITGCAMLVKRQVFEQVGLLDPALFMYGEDVDFCWRARRAGFRLAVVPHAKVWHKVSKSASRDQPKRRYLKTRNQNRFYRVYSSGLQAPLMLIFSLAQNLRYSVQDILHRQFDLLSPQWRGWRDGWFDSSKPDP